VEGEKTSRIKKREKSHLVVGGAYSRSPEAGPSFGNMERVNGEKFARGGCDVILNLGVKGDKTISFQ